MKLKHKLIPLASAAAVCATVAPLVTSCGNSMVSLLDYFIPSTKQRAAGWMTEEAATNYYASAVKGNSQVFIEDLYWTLSTYISNVQVVEKKHEFLEPKFDSVAKVVTILL